MNATVNGCFSLCIWPCDGQVNGPGATPSLTWLKLGLAPVPTNQLAGDQYMDYLVDRKIK